jgi:hypothetical protein
MKNSFRTINLIKLKKATNKKKMVIAAGIFLIRCPVLVVKVKNRNKIYLNMHV